ncbi:hypothetical protein KIL84_011539 [Mauremys mutica]|uniref:Uncharacterized protein n=1 Tax=Mauremys mutica TaxID=74926 RepID=A0A9D4AVF9_9SAUR|nr:hypothetical protein KIL84_011539 [Mauremys mutica]
MVPARRGLDCRRLLEGWPDRCGRGCHTRSLLRRQKGTSLAYGPRLPKKSVTEPLQTPQQRPCDSWVLYSDVTFIPTPQRTDTSNWPTPLLQPTPCCTRCYLH